ncbi:unnamed protein product [Paramecium primaurelia]|uniref:Transmembrane protein n=1 Tax=Paramecium primaurelia TaxID=5886 RepID=A0A8S1QMV4_PARPR|nr:unnamed protein product [Paramecium primaurelia]
MMFILFFHFHFFGIIVEAYYLQHFMTSSISGDEGWLIKSFTLQPLFIHNIVQETQFLGDIRNLDCVQISTFENFNKVRIIFYLYQYILRIDDWPSAQLFYIIVDQWTQSWYFTDNTGSNISADIGSDYSSSQYNDFPLHTLNSIIVELYSDCSTTKFWGLTNFSITLNKCYLGYQFFLDSTTDCIMWILWQSFFQLQNLFDGLEGWIKNKFPTFTLQTNDFQLKMLVLTQFDSVITYLTLLDHLSLIIQFRIEYLSTMPITVRVYQVRKSSLIIEHGQLMILKIKLNQKQIVQMVQWAFVNCQSFFEGQQTQFNVLMIIQYHLMVVLLSKNHVWKGVHFVQKENGLNKNFEPSFLRRQDNNRK